MGSLLARHTVGRLMAVAKEELLDLGLHMVVIGNGSTALLKQTFLKELAAKEKLATGPIRFFFTLDSSRCFSIY